MKIAMFTDAYWPRVNGVTVSVDSFSRALVKEGHEVLIVCSLYPRSNENDYVSLKDELEQESENLFTFIRVPSIPSFVTKEDRIAKFYKWNWVRDKIYDFRPDIIHINSEFAICNFGIWYARTFNLPVIFSFHTMWEDYISNYFHVFLLPFVNIYIRRRFKKIFSHSYRVIVPTVQMETFVKKYRSNVKTCVIPTGFDVKLFQREEAECTEFRKKLEGIYPQIKDKQILLFAGRVAKEKNIDFLLDMLPEILAKHEDVILFIAGNGPDIDYYREEALKKGVEASCVFTGYFERNDLALVYSISKIYVFPSLTETQGLTTLEAMLSGVPVVAIGALGTLTVMGGDNGGFMVKNDMNEFTARVLDLLGDPELYRKKSEEAKKYASSWSIEEMTKKLLTLYQNAITGYIDEFGRQKIK